MTAICGWLAIGGRLSYTRILLSRKSKTVYDLLLPSMGEGRSVKKESSVVNVGIACKHGQLGANQQEYIKNKAEKLLTYFERVTQIQVTVSFDNGRENGRVRVEILVDAEHKHNFVANDEGEDVTPTFDLALHKMETQIKKYKEKIQDHRRDVPLNEMGMAE